MKKRMFLAILLILPFLAAVPAYQADYKAEAATTTTLLGTPTGYTKASDVQYVTVGDYIANWGAREEDCVFLSEYAQDFYTGSYEYATLSKKSGGTSQSDAPTSSLYSALLSMMKTKHTHETGYQETRYQYCYTDCVNSDYRWESCFYTGEQLGEWDKGATWNREHTWPISKSADKYNDDDYNGDIIMLRPTAKNANSSRDNDAYGESSGYYNPNSEGDGKVDLRGDCARIVLYYYVRWGNTGKMWGSSGVMESLSVLLEWMEADPVDTWEMGRNDAVQSITGTRNVFVDYPEYAWLLFGQEVPQDMVTPSSGESTEDIPASSSPSSSAESSDSESSESSESVESTKPEVSESSESSEYSESSENSESSESADGDWEQLPLPNQSGSSSEDLGTLVPEGAVENGCNGSVYASVGIAGAVLPVLITARALKKKKE